MISHKLSILIYSYCTDFSFKTRISFMIYWAKKKKRRAGEEFERELERKRERLRE